jgi:glutaconate CoA-transferase subunit A
MADVADMHRNFSLYLTRHTTQSLVDEVDIVSASRTVHDAATRRCYGYQPGVTSVLTNLGRFVYQPERGRLVLTHLHPGVSVDHAQASTGFPLLIAEKLEHTRPPSAEELRLIREEIDPLGVRRLEFVPTRDRLPLITELLEAEESLLRPLVTASATDQ